MHDARLRTGRISRQRWLELIMLAVFITVVCMGFAAVFVSQNHSVARENGMVEDPFQPVEMYGVMLVWALIAPVVIYAADRLPLRRAHWLRNGLALLVIGIVIALARSLLDATVPVMFEPEAPTPEEFRAILFASMHTHLLLFWTIVSATTFVSMRREADERQRREAELESAVAEAQLRRLRGDLQPHFLFNTLNAAATLVHSDSTAAEQTLRQLSDLLRRSLGATAHEVVLSEELEFVRRYLDLQKIRFGNLRTEIDVRDPDLLAAQVPPLLLQPLVENSIVHGLRKRAGAGSVAVRVFRDDASLRIQVRDDGPGCDPQMPTRLGSIGVPNTRARLQHLYHGRAALAFLRDGGEFVADITLPLHYAS